MIPCISVANMRESDRMTIARFVPSLTLMYRAAMGVFLAADWPEETVIAVGGGNNGGDGFALACILKSRGKRCRVVTLSERLSADSAHFAEKAKSLGVAAQPYEPGAFSNCDTIVDCLLGTGFSGSVREPYRSAIREMNAAPARKISVDIPSGMNGDTGAAELAVRSDLTVTVGYVKTGLVAACAQPFIARLVCADIGIVLDREESRLCTAEAWTEALAERSDIRLAPPWLDPAPIDVRGISYEGAAP